MKVKNKIKVAFDKKTKRVTGFYPYFIKYKKYPEHFIEIEESEWKSFIGKDLIVEDGKINPYEKSNDEKLKHIRNTLISSRKSYLNQTDWQIIRQSEGVKDADTSIVTKRKQARDEINAIEAEESLVNLQNNYQLKFE